MSDDNNNQQNSSSSQSEQESLQKREYRDKDGNVHHHTRTYEEQHGDQNNH